MSNIKISEIFHSIQGEGIHAGTPMAFIRFQGCNLNPGCSYCDTGYAQDKEKGEETSIEQILVRLNELPPFDWVCITGGEPLMQQEGLFELTEALSRKGLSSLIETNGSIPPNINCLVELKSVSSKSLNFFDPHLGCWVDCWSVDVKCPSSGVSVFDIRWLDILTADDYLKFVVGNIEDLNFVKNFDLEYMPCTEIVVQPVIEKSGWDQYRWAARVAEFCCKNNFRFSLQLHKLLWGNKRGV